MKRKSKQERSYTVIEQPDPYEEAFWKHNDTDIYKENLNTFMNKLCNSMEQASHDNT